MKVRIRIFWYLVLLLAGCRDEKPAPLPVLEIVEGTAARSVQVPDTLRFTVRASDEEGLARLRVELASSGANFATLSPPLIYPLSGNSQTIAVAYPLTDTLLDDGSYQLVVRLESQREYSQLFIPVQLVGVPRQVTGLCFLAVSGNTSRLYRSGPDFVLPPNPAVWPLAVQFADYQATLGQIWAAGGGSPTAYRYQLPTNQLIAGTTAQTAPGFPLFTALQLDRNQVFLGRGAGSIWWANGDGSGPRQHLLPEGFYPGALAVSGNRILYDMLPYDPTGLPRIRLIDREREGLIREIPRNGRLVAAHRLNDDQWLLLVEANGKGELLGLAFDGNWEAMSSDIVFEPDVQRCIGVDVRYMLFIIHRFLEPVGVGNGARQPPFSPALGLARRQFGIAPWPNQPIPTRNHGTHRTIQHFEQRFGPFCILRSLGRPCIVAHRQPGETLACRWWQPGHASVARAHGFWVGVAQ